MNPEKPWPSIEALRRTTADRGKTLRERLTVYPEFATRPDPFLAGKMRAPVAALHDDDGRAVEGRSPSPISWQDPDVRWKPRTIALTFAKGADAGLRDDADAVYGETDLPEATDAWARARVEPERLDHEMRSALSKAEAQGPSPTTKRCRSSVPREAPSTPCVGSPTGCARRRSATTRRTVVGNRNINFTNVCYVGCRFSAFAQREVDEESYTLTLERGRRPRRPGVGERRDRGVHAGGDPSRARRAPSIST